MIICHRTNKIFVLFFVNLSNKTYGRDAFRPCSRDSSGDKGQYCFISRKKLNWNRPPLPFLGYIFSSAIWLLQNFSSTTYRPPLPSRLLTRHLKPSIFTTGKIYYLLPKSHKLSLLTANIANLICISLNLKSIIEIITD